MTVRKTIKSYVLRQGKITSGQRNACETLLPKYGINYQELPIDLGQIFTNNNPVIIEIGFGMGNATLEIAKNNPQNNYLGIEVHTPGVGSLLMGLETLNLNNLKVINHDAVQVLKHMILDNSISGFHIYFPDPWPKKKHHKRRLIQTEFVALLTQKLFKDGYIHFASDHQEYANYVLELFSSLSFIRNSLPKHGFIERPATRPLTKFENRGFKLGHSSYDLIFYKN